MAFVSSLLGTETSWVSSDPSVVPNPNWTSWTQQVFTVTVTSFWPISAPEIVSSLSLASDISSVMGSPMDTGMTLTHTPIPVTSASVSSSDSSVTSSTPPPETSTMPTLPPNLGAVTVPGLDTDVFTWVTTTRDDGSSTVLPVVGGLAIWNLPPIPNVLFDLQLPTLKIPKFSLPCIRLLFTSVGNCESPPTPDEDPDTNQPDTQPQPQPPSPTITTTQSSRSCTGTQTTSACQATCSLSRGSDGGTTTDCYTTACSITYAPCSITATTSTTFLSTAAPVQCPLLSTSQEDPCLSDDPDCEKLVHATSSDKRDIITVIGKEHGDKCKLTTNPGLTIVTYPWTPGGVSVLNDDLVEAGIMTKTMDPILTGTRTSLVRWLSTTTDPNDCKPTIVKVYAATIQTNFDQADKGERVNEGATIDHSFEKQWLKGFLDSILNLNAEPLSSLTQYHNPRQINCEDLHNYAFGTKRTRNSLGDIFNALPGVDLSNTIPDHEDNFLSLVGMTRGLNQASKGKVANLNDLSYILNKQLRPGKRVTATDTFDQGYQKVIGSLSVLETLFLGF